MEATMGRRWSAWALAGVGAWGLACGGELAVGDEVVGGEAPEVAEDKPEEPDEAVESADIAAALKALSVTVGDLDRSCHEYLPDSDKALPVARWIGGLRRDASRSEVGCDGTACELQIWIADGTYLELDLELVDGRVDPDDIRCTWAG